MSVKYLASQHHFWFRSWKPQLRTPAERKWLPLARTHGHAHKKIKLNKWRAVSARIVVQLKKSESPACCALSEYEVPSRIQAFPQTLTFPAAHRPPQAAWWECAIVLKQKLWLLYLPFKTILIIVFHILDILRQELFENPIPFCFWSHLSYTYIPIHHIYINMWRWMLNIRS